MKPASSPFGISVYPTDEHDERIPVEAFASAVCEWTEIVRRITLEQSGARPLVRWVVEKLEVGSTHFQIAPILASKSDEEEAIAEVVRAEVPRIVVVGLERMELGDEPSEVFSPEAAEHARLLVRPLLSERIARIVVRGADREIALTRLGAGRDQEPSSKLRSIGSVEGELKAVSFSEPRPYFSIYGSEGGRAVKCYFDEHRFLDQVLANLKQRVLVSGRLARTEDGRATTVADVHRVRRLGGAGLPQPTDLIGIEPGPANGLTSEQWLEWRRRG